MPIEIQAKPITRWILRTVIDESKLKNRSSCVLLDHPLPMRPGRQAIWSDCLTTISIPYHVPGGRGVATEKGRGGFSGKNDKLDTDGQPEWKV
jgi:hypothetical protein